MLRYLSIKIAKMPKIGPLKQSVIFAWLISYATVLLIPLLISAVIYFKTVRVVEEETVKANHFFLKRAEQRMDGLLNDAIRLSRELASNIRINDLLSKEIGEIRPYDLYLVVKELKSYTILNNSIEDFYIYPHNLDVVLSAYSSGDIQSFFQAYIKETGLAYQTWYRLIAAKHYRGDFIPVSFRDSYRRPSKKLLFIRTIPLTYVNGATVNVVAVLDESKFVEDAKDIGNLNQGTVVLLDQSERVIGVAPPDAPVQVIKGRHLTKSAGMFRGSNKGQKVVVSYVVSPQTHWKYITIIPTRVFWQKAEHVRDLFYMNLVLCLISGGLITLYAVKKNYSPVKKLISLLEKYLNLNYDRIDNEYQFIEQAINKAHTDLEKVDGILAQQNMVLRSHFLARLLTGKVAEADVATRMALYDIHFSSESFAVIIFYVTDFEVTQYGAAISTADSEPLENFIQAKGLMVKTLEERFAAKYRVFTTESDDLLVCLINLPSEEVGRFQPELAKMIATARAELLQTAKVHFMVSVSAVHHTIAGIATAYDEAIETMEYQKLLGIEDLLFFNEFHDLPKGSFYYPLDKEHQLVNCIKAGDETKAEAILNEIFAKNFEAMILPVKLARCLMFNLISTMIKTINEVSDEADEDFWMNSNRIEVLLRCESVTEMKSEINRLLQLFCDRVNRKRLEQKHQKSVYADAQLVEKIVAYIHRNYQDINLNIASVAESFKIHPVTLSRIFTEQTGEGLLDYLNRLRITEAEKLIKAGQTNLEAVARSVGYYSSRTFARAFKKYAGVTPGKFKETVIF